ncbi:sugar kinase [Paracoccus sediminicola]|uniref:sugar kinase n=1 Tax=Paracoccus sediminicola TaxID=3017783 RepID=UPI0022F10950|nr:sugar kinase [Paracoccus sediminicola]WBU56524.1 sugar kinase [Paracoccus sediminicola]
MSHDRILSIGEAMVELSQSGQPGLWRLGIAGDTLNTAWYLRRLLPEAWHVGYLSRVGRGEFSCKMIDFLTSEGIDATHVSRDDSREIALYAISLRAGERSFSYWRDSSAARRLADDPNLLARALDGVGIAYFSGITLGILPQEGRDALLDALRDASKAGTRIVFDPNLRAKLWASEAEMCRTVENAAAMADLVLPSFDDEQSFFGDADPQATIARYLDRGAGQVIVKAGGGPVHYGGTDGAGEITGLSRAEPVDTTSAGDSFNAGFLAARIEGADIPAAIRRAHALSLRVIGHHGALVAEAVPPRRS